MEASYLRQPGFRGRCLVQGQRGVYHVMSRTSCGQYLFDDEAKGVFLKLLQKQAGFCGVDVLAYCVMGNHFHLLVAVPAVSEIPDSELLGRYRLLYGGKNCPASSASPEVLAKLLAANEEEGQLLRERILGRMHDLSGFVRELKQRFGIWYNHRHGNKGTIWADRFTSVVVEPAREAMSTVAAYIDLNSLRAELVSDPAEYPFSSYGCASGGQKEARLGYTRIFGDGMGFEAILPSYNLILYGKGATSKGTVGKDRGTVSESKLSVVVKNGGKLPLSEILRRRVRYFTAGGAIGSPDFLEHVGAEWKTTYGLQRKRDAYPMRYGEWGGLQSFRNLQVEPVGMSKRPSRAQSSAVPIDSPTSKYSL